MPIKHHLRRAGLGAGFLFAFAMNSFAADQPGGAAATPTPAPAGPGADFAPEPGERKTIRWNNPERPEFPGLVHGSFTSAAMGGVEVGYNVFLPADYATSSARYPVVYFLHGAGGDENSDAAAFSGVVREHVRRGTLPPVLCVFPNGGRSGYRDHPDTGVRVESCIVRELLPLIDRTYRTRSDRESRVVLGFSMGGGGAVRLAVKYPDLFSAAGSWGAAFLGRNYDRIPDELAPDKLRAVADRVRLLMIVGTADFTLRAHPPFVQNLAEAQFPFGLEVLAGVEHDPGAYYEHSGERMLHFLAAKF